MNTPYTTAASAISRRKILHLSALGMAGLAIGCSQDAPKPAANALDIEARLTELGITLPKAPKAVAAYATYRIVGDMVYIAGQGPALNSDAPVLGKVGKDITLEQAKYAARLACINILSQAKAACGGDLGRIVQWVKMGGFVNCTDDFKDHPKVINGATELLFDIFGQAGLPARFAVGASSLPFNICVEIDASFQIRT